MRRVIVIALSFVLTLGLSTWLILRTWGAAAKAEGHTLYSYRDGYRLLTWRNVPPSVPLVVWMGDSTILGLVRRSYPQILTPRLEDDARISTQVVSGPAFDFYTYYFLMGPVLAMNPDLIVIVAHLASFNSKTGTRFTYNDLSSRIPLGELPHATLLPLAPRRLSPSRLALAQLLETHAGEDVLYVGEGLRHLWGDAGAWDAFGPKRPPAAIDWRKVPPAAKGYDFPLTRRNPTLRMMEATLRMATSRGHKVIVLGTPIPYMLVKEGWRYDSGVLAKRYAVLRAAVEGAGATFVDLHEAVPAEEFVDVGGHFTDKGALHMAEMLHPVVLQAVQEVVANKTASDDRPR